MCPPEPVETDKDCNREDSCNEISSTKTGFGNGLSSLRDFRTGVTFIIGQYNLPEFLLIKIKAVRMD